MSCLASCCASITCGLCTSAASSIANRSARIGCCLLFGVSLIISWVLREFTAPLLKQRSWIIILRTTFQMNGSRCKQFFMSAWEFLVLWDTGSHNDWGEGSE